MGTTLKLNKNIKCIQFVDMVAAGLGTLSNASWTSAPVEVDDYPPATGNFSLDTLFTGTGTLTAVMLSGNSATPTASNAAIFTAATSATTGGRHDGLSVPVPKAVSVKFTATGQVVISRAILGIHRGVYPGGG